MNSCELAAAITAVAVSLANNLSDQELQLTAAVFDQLNTTLTTILSKRTICEERCKALGEKNTDTGTPLLLMGE